MSRLLRLLACAAPLLVSVSATEQEFFEFQIPSGRHLVNSALKKGPQLQQVNLTNAIEVIQIPTSLFSAQCGELLAGLNTDNGGQLAAAGAAVRRAYTDLVVSVFGQCVIPDLLDQNEIDNNSGDLVVINASPCAEVANLRENFESVCSAAISAAPPSVCDLTFLQNFFLDEPGNSIEASISYDVYWCFPDVCSADDVERFGAFIAAELNNGAQVDSSGESVFGAWSTCSDEFGRVRDFNGGAESFITGLTVSGSGLAQNTEASAVVVSVDSSLSPTPLVSDVVCKITQDLPAEDFCKNCCAQLNLNTDFSSTYRMYCDCDERNPSPSGLYNMSIYSPFEDIQLLCQADTNAQDNQPSNQPLVPCTNFLGQNTVGVSLSGETFPFDAEQMPTQVFQTPLPEDLPVIIEIGQTLPPQVITGNGQAPPLIQILNPAADSVGATRPAFVALFVCAAAAFFSS